MISKMDETIPSHFTLIHQAKDKLAGKKKKDQRGMENLLKEN